MKTRTTKSSASSTRKRTTQRSSVKAKVASPLAICPADGAGWCPYPFSIEQLKRHLRNKASAAEEPQLVTASTGKTR